MKFMADFSYFTLYIFYTAVSGTIRGFHIYRRAIGTTANL